MERLRPLFYQRFSFNISLWTPLSPSRMLFRWSPWQLSCDLAMSLNLHLSGRPIALGLAGHLYYIICSASGWDGIWLDKLESDVTKTGYSSITYRFATILHTRLTSMSLCRDHTCRPCMQTIHVSCAQRALRSCHACNLAKFIGAKFTGGTRYRFRW